MAFDIQSIVKDNWKLILSVLGIFILSILSAMNVTSPNSLMTINSISNNGVTSNDKQQKDNTDYYGDAKPISNGNANKYAVSPSLQLEEGVDYRAEIVTEKGDIKIDLFEDEAPQNVNNFVFLASNNYYDGTSFHRIMKDYIIQGGDPLGNGSGGPGYYISDEISERRFEPFILAMTNAQEDANGSQFFITTRSISRENMEEYLQGRYTIIGEVVNGFNVVDNIELERVDDSKMPYNPVIVTTINIYTGSSPFDN